MNKAIFFIFVLLSFISNSQNFDISMNVSKADLAIKTFNEDPNAEAIMIYDYGNTYYNKETWRLNFELKQKFKILTKDGLERGQKEIPLYIGKNSKESISDISATVYNLENDEIVVSKIAEDAIYEEKNENFKIVKLVLPNVKVGSIITLSYTKSSPFVNKYQPWYFQSDIPVLYSEYNASIPGNYEYNIKLVGSLPLDINTSDIEYNCLEAGGGASANCAIYRYVMTNIPAYRQEKYTTSANNYLSRIEYELSVIRQFNGEVEKLTKSWDDVDKELKSDSNFGRQVSKEKLVKDVLPKNIRAEPWASRSDQRPTKTWCAMTMPVWVLWTK